MKISFLSPEIGEEFLEQGGLSSSDFYKVYNNLQLNLAQDSDLGVPIGPVTISCVGQADDVALVSTDPKHLQGLVDISLYYCRKFKVSLATNKTKLLLFSTKTMSLDRFYLTSTVDIDVGGDIINFVDKAEHVGAG